MMTVRALSLIVAGLSLTAACAGQTAAPATTLTRPRQDLVALLPDPESGKVGRAIVTGAGATVDLDAPRAATTVAAGQPPAAVTTLAEDEVARLFGDTLSALPLAPRHFTLYFKFESEELTDQSRALVKEVLDAVTARPVPDVIVVGHTDTTGAARANIDLGLRRANTVRTLLVDTGIDARAVEVASHGEAELLVPTADSVYEARNRRVEISVR